MMFYKPTTKIIEFLKLTFSITWLCWGTIIIANQFGHLRFGTPLSVVLFMIGGNGAPIASYILLKKWGEVEGIKDFLKKFMNFKSEIKNYALIVALIVLHFALPISLAGASNNMATYLVLIMIPFNIVGGGLEEIGWRGILQPKLEQVTSFGKATLITGIVWIIWHMPLWLIAGTYQYGSSLSMFFILVFGLSFSLALIRKTTGSIFLCILFHSCINSMLAVFSIGQNYSTLITMILEITLALVIVKGLTKRKVSEIME